jgi:hypothetical protein
VGRERKMRRSVLLYAACWLAILCRTGFGQATQSFVQDCSPAMLDVSALPTSPTATYGGHLFVLEFHNISTGACSLWSPQISLFPTLDTNNQPRFAELRPDDPGYVAVPHPQILQPAAWAHVVLEWTSHAGPELACDEYSELRVGFSYQWQEAGKPGVVVRHLWIRACGPFGYTDYRLGRYSSHSPIPRGWLNWYGPDGLAGVTFPQPTPSTEIADGSSQLSLVAGAKRTMLGDRLFSLRLNFPRLAAEGCAFSQMRKREADGSTVISIEQCDSSAPPRGTAPPVLPLYHDPGVMLFAVGNAGFLPQHVGPLKYEVTAPVRRTDGVSTSTAYARASVDLIAHDPALPGQVPILDPLPACSTSQLRMDPLPPILASSLRTLRAYNATNISTQSCSLAGVPRTRGLDARGDYQVFLPPSCPNCNNEFFLPRPNGRIDLHQGETAHLLAGATGSGKDYCTSTPTLELSLDRDASPTEPFNARPLPQQTAHSIYVPFEGHDCVSFDISAWRQGAFDGKPLSKSQIELSHEDGASSHVAIPVECNKPELLAHGRPYPIEGTREPAYSFSMPEREFTRGDPMPLYIWTVNTSDKAIERSVCSYPAFLKAGGFVLYDAYGHRILNNRQVASDKECKADPAGYRSLLGCSGASAPPIPPHSCANSPIDLNKTYELPPGEYTLSTRDPGDADSCPLRGDKPYTPNPNMDIIFRVSQP